MRVVSSEPHLEEEELWVLSYYRASELAGSLLFGRLARRAEDGDLRIFLTQHFAQEAQHAWIWTDTIVRLGAVPLHITETYQSLYAREMGIPLSMTEIFVLTEIFEERIRKHFTRHAARPGVHPIIKATLEKMLEDEKDHIDWISKRLENEDGSRVSELRERYARLDERIYADIVRYEQQLWTFLGDGKESWEISATKSTT